METKLEKTDEGGNIPSTAFVSNEIQIPKSGKLISEVQCAANQEQIKIIVISKVKLED